ncbi:MAG: class I SAM-dependent methyltransferase [Bacillota bacterium]
MKVSKRMEAIASLVSENTIFADIGTDHGYLPIYLCLTQKIQTAYACDVAKKPLEKAIENSKLHGVSTQITPLLGSGFSELRDLPIDSAVIAGMGGMLMVDIIKNDLGIVQALKELIVSPHHDLPVVRKYLHEIGFAITKELMILDDGKYYTIVHAIPQKEVYDKEIFYTYGKYLLEEKNPLLLEKLLYEEAKTKALLLKLQNTPHEVSEAMTTTKTKLQEIKEAMTWFAK